MNIRHSDFYSHILGQRLNMSLYGHGGQPCLVFPSQDGNSRDFEGFGMVEVCRPWIEAGRLRLYCVDSLDQQTWSAYHRPPRERMQRQEAWFAHLVEEFVPFMHHDSGHEGRLMTLGCSLGAFHAANALLRRPDLFESVIALSGAYDARWLLAGYMDELAYLNSPLDSIRGMPRDHPWIRRYQDCRIILCCGQGAWEEEMLRSLRLLEAAMRDKGIHPWVDIWGFDVNHDWDWWRVQLAYFLGKLMP
ncbi:MAG: esterase family protein [Clostridiales bacterium]|nr:esterase family protein [Clostridiales bacterium]